MSVLHIFSAKNIAKQWLALYSVAAICFGCVVAPTTGIDKFSDDKLRYDLFAVMVNSNALGGEKLAQSKQLLLAEAQKRGKITPAEMFKLETRAKLYKDAELYWQKPVQSLTLAFGKPDRILEKELWKIYVYRTDFEVYNNHYYEEIDICIVGDKVFNYWMSYERESSSFQFESGCTTRRLEDMFQKPRI